MARKVVNRKAKAAEVAAAAEIEKKAPKKTAKKSATPRKKSTRKTKAQVAAEVRKKLYWVVYSQNMKRVAVFEFDQKAEALARAEDLSKSGKSPHFVQSYKEEIQLEVE